MFTTMTGPLAAPRLTSATANNFPRISSLSESLAGKNYATGGRHRPGIFQSLTVFKKQAKLLETLGRAGRKTTIQLMEECMKEFQKRTVTAERLLDEEYRAVKNVARPMLLFTSARLSLKASGVGSTTWMIVLFSDK
jgi:hypothetical protein